MDHLNQKRQELAAMQEAANVAREQALALLRLQRRVAEIDALAFGDVPAACASTPASAATRHTLAAGTTPGAMGDSVAAAESSLSLEDRRRFGLDFDQSQDSGITASLRQAEAQARTGGSGGPSCGDTTGALESVTRTLNGVAGERREDAGTPTPAAGSSSSLSVEDRRRFGLDLDDGLTQRRGGGLPEVHAPVATRQAASLQATFQHHPDVLWGGIGGSRESGAAAPTMQRTILQLEAVGATKLVADLKESERRLQSMKMTG